MAKRRPETDDALADGALDTLRNWNKHREEELIGALLMRPEIFHDVRAVLGPDDFHGYRARTIYAAMVRLDDRNRPLDADSLIEELQNVPDIGVADVMLLHGGQYLLKPPKMLDYARAVREAATRRRLVRALDAAKTQLADDGDIETARAALYSALDGCDIRERSADLDTWDAVLGRLASELDHVERRPTTTGFHGLDAVCGGMSRGALILIGARTSVGKTAFATSMAVELAQQGKRVSFISVEMDALSIAMRYVGAASGVSMRSLQQRELSESEMQQFVEAFGTSLPLCTDDTSRTLAQARARVHQHRRLLGGLDVVMLDYVQLVSVEAQNGEKRYEALGRLSRGLKRMAQDLGVTVIALCQLSRRSDERADEPPRLSDLRESGDLEQDADQVWLLWRPPKSSDNWAGRLVKVIVAKNRQGPTGVAEMRFQPGRMRFWEIDEEADEP